MTAEYDSNIQKLKLDLECIEKVNTECRTMIKGEKWQHIIDEQLAVRHLESKMPKKFFADEICNRRVAERANEIE